MIRHIVFWHLSGETAEEKRSQAQTVKTALEALNGKIPGLLKLEIGFDFSATADSADVALYSEFESREALDAYQRHPEHQKVVPIVAAVRTARRMVDYEV